MSKKLNRKFMSTSKKEKKMKKVRKRTLNSNGTCYVIHTCLHTHFSLNIYRTTTTTRAKHTLSTI